MVRGSRGLQTGERERWEFGKAQGADYTVHILPGGGKDGGTLMAGGQRQRLGRLDRRGEAGVRDREEGLG